MLDVVYVTGVACSFKKMLLLFAVFVMSGGLSALMFSQNSNIFLDCTDISNQIATCGLLNVGCNELVFLEHKKNIHTVKN